MPSPSSSLHSPAASCPLTPPASALGIVVRFADEQALLTAAAKVRDAGYRRFDVHTPYPVHGMDQAMGLGRSRLGWIVAAGATLGAIATMTLCIYPSAVEYPIITGGKPYNSWPVFIIIAFEGAVLCSAFAAVFGMFALNGLPNWYHPARNHQAFIRSSDDAMVLLIEASDRLFDPYQTGQFLAELGGQEIELVHEEPPVELKLPPLSSLKTLLPPLPFSSNHS